MTESTSHRLPEAPESLKEAGLRPGRANPLGATWDGHGVNFALFSEDATGVELQLFDDPGDAPPTRRIRMLEPVAHVWRIYVPGAGPGQLYGYRVHGPFRPEHGLRFNPSKLLLDPYARAICGKVNYDQSCFGYPQDGSNADLLLNSDDSAARVPRSVVVDAQFDWGDDPRPQTPWPRTVIYEAHVKGLTARHPDVPEELRGTYSGLAHPAVIDHLKKLGVTAVELLPVHHHVDEKTVLDRGLSNYWGYSTIGFFAPDSRFSSQGDRGGQVTEFRQMVRALHEAGLEVILDVVYNHTAEGSHLGPTFCFRGIDNRAYYRLQANARLYHDFTGCGNSLNPQHPRTLQLVMDSLHYWALEMHVDGFRFDLATALGREQGYVDCLSAFFDIIQQDPVLSQVKLIAEPWDVGEGGYQVGNFPVLWTEWNGQYRDTVRRFWRGDPDQLTNMARRMTGSSDLYQDDGRRPFASINFVTSHDGFTLHDLVSYNHKHNEANQEENRDGADENFSANYGQEGPTEDEHLRKRRERQKRNFLATLFLSQGVPMLLGGDEIGHTQSGNNNAYCQDNGTTWHDWTLDDPRRALRDFIARLAAFRRDHPTFRRRKFLTGQPIQGSEGKDLAWLTPEGTEMTQAQWHEGDRRVLGMLFCGEAFAEFDYDGERVHDDSFLMLINAGQETAPFRLPEPGARWEAALHTYDRELTAEERQMDAGMSFPLEGRSVVVFKQVRPRSSFLREGRLERKAGF